MQSFNAGQTMFSQKIQHEPNLYMQQMCQNFTGLNLNQEVYSQQPKCNSDSGTSSADIDQAVIKDEVVYRMKDEVTGYDMTRKTMPGPWFFEEGNGFGRSEDSPSPTSDQSEDLANLLAGNRIFSQNVEVPSSEHVAEIVGRQGCKIKALRHKTSTYIKTPVRGEDPVFVVSGKQEDVMEAKREIECAAEHFTQIRASRRHSQGGAPAPGHVTAYVRVPLRVVGLVVGPKGATIKRIQQDTHTYIITPSREREPVFEVTGLIHNVEAARKEIEQHIYQRTGNMPITDPSVNISNFQMPANHFENQNAMRPGPGFENMHAIRRPSASFPFAPHTERSAAPSDLAGLNTISNMLRYHTSPTQSAYGNGNGAPLSAAHSAEFLPPPPQKRVDFSTWSPNPYVGLGIGPAANHGRVLTGPSSWSFAADSKEERLGGSPLPSLGIRGVFDSIWADTQDENKHPSMNHMLAA